jgi:hypothetical protein
MGNDFGMQYIMDGNGNYYTVNSSNQLVVAKDRDEASVFTFFEANQRIGGGKKARFYQIIPVGDFEETEQEMLANVEGEQDEVTDDPIISKIFSIVDKMFDSEQKDEVQPKVDAKTQPTFEYCMENVDWNEFVNYFIFVASGAKGYQEELAKKHSDIEKEICDLLHYVELFDLSDDEGLKAMEMLKDARQRRRDVKDEISRTEYFQKMLGTSANVAKARGILTELKKLDTRKYFPRQLEGLFNGMEGRATDRDLFRKNRDMQNSDSEEETDDYIYEEEEKEMSFVETVFDNRENDWLSFARQQMEFYQNVGQYMINLQIEMGVIDTAIEDVMEKIEDANYNVTQGYKVFKELKDLRNERKAKAQELEVLRTMTECFDINSMADALAYNADEVERITAPATVDSVVRDEAV